MTVPVGPGTKVILKFGLKLENGDEVDSTGSKPAEFTVGDGKLLPGFEKAMFGMRAGDADLLEIDPEDGFGPHNEDNIQRFRRDEFPLNMELSEGLMYSFADQARGELPGVICHVGDDWVEVDFNHPLAGRKLLFDVQILKVEQVSQNIIAVKH